MDTRYPHTSRIENALLTAVVVLLFPLLGRAQTGVKTNLLDDAMLMPNASIEVSAGNHYSLALSARYAPVALSEDHKWKHWAVAPEVRYWPWATFRRWYVGLEPFVAGYNAAGLYVYGLRDRRKEGMLYGAAITVGYAWQLSPRLNLEAGTGLGYAYTRFDKYDAGKCGYPHGRKSGNVFGMTQLGVSLVYFIHKR